ncbi:competence protein CoiA family protein [Lentilactobacillus diolivorans]|uniref:competence protein CoiA n=1 Tax=Lentilactobacillus diolivorans TaxID=179838 RepID=UPI002468E01A|nr:competence protein CoiA family protein [Lentilactobacillus diolivorans]MDH5105388.1 competence protein CoiA family protein [Lentilactobacillus diolivorans]
MLIAMSEGQLVQATKISRTKATRLNFICPGCKQRVILKSGKYRIPHFSHQSKVACAGFSENESQTHLEGKLFFKQEVEAMGEQAILEFNMPVINQRADLFIAGKNIILEYQCSPISFESIQQRTANYRQLGKETFWILGDRHRKRLFTNEMIAKFARFHSRIGFYIIFYSAKNHQFWLHYQIHEVAGRLDSRVELFDHLGEVFKFIKQFEYLTNGRRKKSKNQILMLNQLKRIQQSNTRRNRAYLDMVTMCYIQGRRFVGCPMICHNKQAEGRPIFKKSILCWKVWVILAIFERQNSQISNQQLNQIFKESVQKYGYEMAQVQNYVRFFQMEFTSFILSLRSAGYIIHTVSGIKIINFPRWFETYDQKKNYIMTNDQLL